MSSKSWKLVGGAAIAAWFVGLVIFEQRHPLRKRVENTPRHTMRNGVVAGMAVVLLQLLEQPLVSRLSQRVARKKQGMLQPLRKNRWLYLVVACAAMDYTLYLWHLLTHKSKLLWRFHVVHHVDLDLDASTALRFHFGELGISVIWRLLQVRLLGITPGALRVWQNFLMASIMFHHSNLRLPISVERLVGVLFVTPRMHGIHHSTVEDETNSNWSSGLTIWDRLHGTYRDDVPQEEIMIGVPAYHDAEDVSLVKIIAMPFFKQGPTWS